MKKNKILAFALILAVIISAFGLYAVHAAGGKYVALGDSIPAGYGLSYTSERYTNILAGKIGYTQTNYAVSGHKTSDLLARIKTSGVTNSLKQADLVTISIGGNDFISDLSSILYALAGSNSLFSECENNLNQITSYLKANTKSTCVIIYQDIGNCYKYTSYGSLVSTAINRVNSIIENQCDGERVFFCNVSTNLEKSADNFFASQGGDYAFDPHPTAKGHKSIASDMYSTFTYAKAVVDKANQTSNETTSVSTTHETVYEESTFWIDPTDTKPVTTESETTSWIDPTDTTRETTHETTHETTSVESTSDSITETVQSEMTFWIDPTDTTRNVTQESETIETIETKETKETEETFVFDTTQVSLTQETTESDVLEESTVYINETTEIVTETPVEVSIEETTSVPEETTESNTQKNNTGKVVLIVLFVAGGAACATVAVIMIIIKKRK